MSLLTRAAAPLALGASLILGLAVTLPAAAPFPWPHGERYAVSLTYDDTLASQLANAVPSLQAAGLRGTFFLITSKLDDPAQKARWAEVAAMGHEVTSHTVNHPCAKANAINLPGQALEDYDTARMAKELDASLGALAPWNKARLPWSFAYPCGMDWVGPEHDSYVAEVQKRFIAARGCVDKVVDPASVDLMHVPGAHSGEDLVSWVEYTEKSGGWLVFYFHGVGGDYLSVKNEDHQILVDYLKNAQGLAWVAPFGEVAAWVKSKRPKDS